MEDKFEDFIKVIDALEKHEVDYVLIGGVAVILHGMQRLTSDVDFFVKSVPENLDKLRRALYSIYNDPSIEEITLSELNEYPVIRYGTPSGFYIDIMARLGEIATYESLKYEMIDYNGIKIKIATPETLYELKKDTLRAKDKIDAVFLRELIEANKANSPSKE